MSMDISLLKQEICEVGYKLWQGGYVVGNDGNISYKVSDSEIWTTPTGVSKGSLTPEMLVCINIDGKIVEGNRNPSSESAMHLRVYKHREDIHAVVHAHPPAATAFAVCRRPLDKKYVPESIVNLGIVPVAEYGTPSTEAVPDSIEPFIRDYQAVLLANHGALTWDDSLTGAYYKMETVEYLAKLYINIDRVGTGVELDDDEIERLINLRKYYKEIAEKKGAF